MAGSRLHVHLCRDSFNTPWGFRLQGGKDLCQALTVQRVFSNSPAEGELQRGDVIIAIGGEDTTQLTHKQAQDCIKHGGGQINLVINRPLPGTAVVSPISPPIITQRPRAPSIKEPPSPNAPYRQIHITTYDRDSHPQPPSPHHHHHHHHNQTPYTNSNNTDGNMPIHQHPHPHHHQQQHHPHHHHHQQHQQQHPHHHHPQPQTNGPHKPPRTPTHAAGQPFHQAAPFQPQRRPRDPYSQPPFQSPTTPTTPPPPWATQQAAPRKVSKLSELGSRGGEGGGFSFGTDYCTLPRRGNRQNNMAYHSTPRPAPRRSPERDDVDAEYEPRATGPPPKVCSLSSLGGGGAIFGSSYGSAATLPRRNVTRRQSQPPSMPSHGGTSYGFTPTKVTLNKYGGGGPQFGSDFSAYKTPAQRYEPQTEKGVMLNRVQSSLDNITLSPKTPEPAPGSPFYPQYPVPQQAPANQQPQQQVYTPTGLLLEQQRLEEEERKRQQQLQQQQYQQQQQQQQYQQPQQPQYAPAAQQYQSGPGLNQDEVDEGEVIVPVWERRKQFQQPEPSTAVRTPKSKSLPKIPKPKPGSTPFGTFGVDYAKPARTTSQAVWQPSPQAQPAVAQYTPTPVTPEPPVKSTPPAWQRPQTDNAADDDETDATPAWRNTLRTTGVKPWDVDVNYSQQQQPVRSVPYNPVHYQNPPPVGKAPAVGPRQGGSGGGGGGDGDTEAPKVVHLQYNSPMGLYSRDNVQETLRGQTQAINSTGSPSQNTPTQPGLPGERDWSQSAVLRFIEQEGSKKPKARPGPATAPKPAGQPAGQPVKVQHTMQLQPHPVQAQQRYDDVGVSDF